MIYDNMPKNKNIVVALEPYFNISFIQGPRVEISNARDSKFNVVFRDKTTQEVVHTGTIGNNSWIKANKRYYVEWEVLINNAIYKFSLAGKRVYISLDSSSLGDTLAWLPFVDEFRKKHKCELVCSTFENELFQENYPEIEFVKPGTVVNNILAMYNIGWYHNEDGSIDLFRNPVDFKTEPLQKTASNILGLEYQEIRPKLTLPHPEKKNQVCIAIHATAQAKYWNNENGWQKIVNYMKSRGYEVILLSKEGDGYMGNWHPQGVLKHPEGSLSDVIRTLRESKLFIGIGSGLSWLSWACEVPTVIISGFSEPYTEPQRDVVRIGAPVGACRGCFNRHRLDAGDWNWCPEHKGTDRQFECTKLLEGEEVIDKIKNLL